MRKFSMPFFPISGPQLLRLHLHKASRITSPRAAWLFRISFLCELAVMALCALTAPPPGLLYDTNMIWIETHAQGSLDTRRLLRSASVGALRVEQ
jgi:hypothetical protein